MTPFKQEIRFARAPDGTRLAYAVHGDGAGIPLVQAAHWLTHIGEDWKTPVWRPWYDALGARYRLYRYDARGCGLSDRDSTDSSLDVLVTDLEAIVDAAKLDRFALLGTSQGGALSIAYAARHPERVSHIVLLGAFARGPLRRDPTADAARQPRGGAEDDRGRLGAGQPGLPAAVHEPDVSGRDARADPLVQRSTAAVVLAAAGGAHRLAASATSTRPRICRG